ncbi:hypothetical protein [Actinoplanes sp. NPDC048796]|uniref:hypothetical protein n=1 Tax=unclassified Actinoplanes TaxID=2626549 RepID=UPI0033E3DB30
MTIDDDRLGDDGVEKSPKRHRKLAVGAAGLAVVLGGGAYLVATQATENTETSGVGAIGAPATVAPAPASPSPQPTPSPSATSALPSAAPSPASASPSRKPVAAKSTKPVVKSEVKREIQKAREAAEKEGHPVRRGLSAAGTTKVAASQRTETTADGTMRVITAKGDLTGQNELLWAADKGEKVGTARCTQRFRFSAGDPGRERPSMLLCWRTSEGRSVVTVAVAKKGRPSPATSVATINREWSKLG